MRYVTTQSPRHKLDSSQHSSEARRIVELARTEHPSTKRARLTTDRIGVLYKWALGVGASLVYEAVIDQLNFLSLWVAPTVGAGLVVAALAVMWHQTRQRPGAASRSGSPRQGEWVLQGSGIAGGAQLGVGDRLDERAHLVLRCGVRNAPGRDEVGDALTHLVIGQCCVVHLVLISGL